MVARVTWTCAFCGSSDGPKSREHLFRNAWIEKLKVDEVLIATKRTGPDSWADDQMIRTSSLDYQVSGVCQPCNGGWMNALDTAAEDVVLGLANGRTREIPSGQQGVLIDWAAKTALVRALFDRNLPHVLGQYRYMARTHSAPPGTFVQIALAARAASAAGMHSTAGLTAKGTRNSKPQQLDLFAFGLGCFVFHVFLSDGRLARSTGHEIFRVVRNVQEGRYLVLDRAVKAARSVGQPSISPMTYADSRIASDLIRFWESDDPLAKSLDVLERERVVWERERSVLEKHPGVPRP